MITELNKREIYDLLKEKLNFNEPYGLSAVGKELTASGHGCRRYGFARMKNLMKELKEFIVLEDYEYDGHSNSNVMLLPWQEKKGAEDETENNHAAWIPTSSEMAELENEMGTGILKIGAIPKKVQEPIKRNFVMPLKEAVNSPYQKRYTQLIKEPVTAIQEAKQSKQELTEQEKEKIYQILCGRFPKEEELHMAKISKYLVERGFSPKNYGFSKMKNMLQQMQAYLKMRDVTIHGVPNVLITILEHPLKAEQYETDIAKKEEVSFSYEEKIGKTEQEEEKSSEKAGDFERLAYLPPKIIEFLMRRGMKAPEEELAAAYQRSLAEKTVQVRSYSITFPLMLDEEEMIAVLKRNERPYGKQWYLSFVGSPKKEQEDEEDREEEHPIPPGKSLEHFADLGYWQDFLKELADLALPERWDSDNRRYGRYFILKKYMQYTFYRLLQEEKVCISQDRQFAAFNTGLVNNHYDDIYACFVPNPQKGKEEWKFEGFAMAGIRGKNGYGKLLTSYFNPLPQVPSYVEKNEDLIYDLTKELLTDYEHIIIDNLHRLPLGYLRECCYGDDQALEMIAVLELKRRGSEAQKQAYTALSNYIAENDKIFRRLRSRMEDAIEIALKRVRWNFRTAIPCYFPKGNCMSLMLPLCLEDDSNTDAALVVQKNPSGSYQGQTVLRLDQAYLDARLICRPNTDWLQPGEEDTFSNKILQKY